MFKLKQSLAAVACLLLAIALAAAVGPRTGYGQKAAAQPSPVPLPLNVNVVNTPLPVAGAVSVGNTADAPVPVREVGAPARRLVSFTHSFIIGNGDAGGSGHTAAHVPAGKRFVIEAASALLNLPEGQAAIVNFAPSSDPSLGAPGPLLFARHHLPVTFQGTFAEFNGLDGQRNIYVGAEKVLAVAEPDTYVYVLFSRNSATGEAFASVTLTGYVEDLPQQ